jgi:hypothetical protein
MQIFFIAIILVWFLLVIFPFIKHPEDALITYFQQYMSTLWGIPQDK